MHIICVLIYQTPMFKHMGSNTYPFSTFYFCFPNLQDCTLSFSSLIILPWALGGSWVRCGVVSGAVEMLTRHATQTFGEGVSASI